MKHFAALIFALALTVLSGCQTSITDARTPDRNNGASNFANVADENRARERVVPQHGNADRP